MKRSILSLVVIVSLVTSCSPAALYKNGAGFYYPYTMSPLTVPDGPPEFQQGWRDGCRTSLGFGAFKNAKFGYSPAVTKGLSGNPSYQAGWNWAWSACVVHANMFVAKHETLDDTSSLTSEKKAFE